MTTNATRPDVEAVLAGLKDFQRRSVEYAFRRLYTDDDRTRRFLIADEAGLGKTLVARGIIAKAIDHLWDTIDRIDVVYICSNVDIARQNVSRLNVTTDQHFALVSRATLLPLKLRNLKREKLNFVSFTPSTSFDLRSQMGIKSERTLLYWLLRDKWGLHGAASLNLFQGDAGRARFRELIGRFKPGDVDQGVTEKFHDALDRHVDVARREGHADIRARFDELCEHFGRTRKRSNVPTEVRKAQRRIVGELRGILAGTCMQALEPDLIIMDEFQRFKHLLEGEDDSARLAQSLFEWTGEEPEAKARVLLLSATPYKMYTVADEAGGEDHYADFLRTLRFLESNPDADSEYAVLLNAYREQLFRLGDGTDELRRIKTELERRLRKVMVRTERLAVSADRDGMLVEMPTQGAALEVKELLHYQALQRLASLSDKSDTIEYWKSAPYLVNFMEGYQFKKRLLSAMRDPEAAPKVASILNSTPDLLLSSKDIQSYRDIDPANTRMRWLVKDMIDNETWRLLWLSPSLPYYEPGGSFADERARRATKRLIFSAWRVVPKAIATLLSYAAECRMMLCFDREAQNTPEARERRTGLLRLNVADGRPAGMPVLGLMYPSVALAKMYDPLQETKAGGVRSAAEVVRRLEKSITEALEPIVAARPDSGPEDERWYWAAPIALDLRMDESLAEEWWKTDDLAYRWSNEEVGEEGEDIDDKGWYAHVDHAKLVASALQGLGRPPADLVTVMAQMAIASPAIAALRSYGRLLGPDSLSDIDVRFAAAQLAWSFRSLFNQPETMALIRGMKGEEPYWRRVLEYCVDGNLQAVLDEYFHVLRDSLGLRDKSIENVVDQVGEEACKVLTLRTATLGVDDVTVKKRSVQVSLRRMRVRYALRYGDEKSDDDKEANRAEHVRAAFNSPFWPFVLASTSVGQEGLDFHQYCHAVVHWNLPSNPVDLEQREGRVHRYKGHAVRKNVAAKHRDALRQRTDADPWDTLFSAASEGRDSEATDLVPFWIYPIEHGAKIERYVPALPLSKDAQRFESLRRSLVVYRMVFGQPRQEDLVAYLLHHLKPEQIEEMQAELRIDLTPPAEIKS